jgi:hypothetical protein
MSDNGLKSDKGSEGPPKQVSFIKKATAMKVLSALVTWCMFFSVSLAQPFDTLLSQFNQIIELYPLKDSTYFVIGFGDQYQVERIDAQANILWSTTIGPVRTTSMTDYNITIKNGDTSIQVLMSERTCDVFGNNKHRSYTLNSMGNIIDQQYLSNAPAGGVAVLSGQADGPRLAFAQNKWVVIVDVNGDTTRAKLNWGTSDTTNTYLIGKPVRFAVCPGGDVIVGSEGGWVFTLQNVAGKFRVVDYSWSNHGRTLLCLQDGAFIEDGSGSISIWQDQIFSNYYIWPDGYILPSKIQWRDPYLAVRVHGLSSPDSVFLFDRNLALHRTIEVPDEHRLNSVILTDKTDFYAGYGNTYYDDALLLSVDRLDQTGPLNYDLALVDYQLGPIDTSYALADGYYHYELQSLTVTIQNNCDYMIDRASIAYAGWNGFCGDTIWYRYLQDLNILPGETRSLELHNVFIRKLFPESEFDKTCIVLLQPDSHLDDQFDDNQICKRIEFPLSTPDSEIRSIRLYPTIVDDKIYMQSDDAVEVEARIFTSLGIMMGAFMFSIENEYSIDVSHYPAGLYMIQCLVQGSPWRVSKFFKE